MREIRPLPAIVEINLEDQRWSEHQIEDWSTRACNAALDYLNLGDADFEISLLACADSRISDLNREFRGKPLPTNVLSWPSEERGAKDEGASPVLPDPGNPMDWELGDIAIAFDTCWNEAHEAGKQFEQHVTHLLVHATLHLLGYDHERDADAALMEGLETNILEKLGHPNPYEQKDEAIRD